MDLHPQKIALLCLGFLLWSCQPEVEEQPTLPPEVSYEQHRPRFHFSPPSQWMNDPNGMVYYEGEWHLFYQHYPDSTVWGPMHWGHAVSTDLIHWEHLPIALYPDKLGYIFSGSAVVDHQNTSGLGQNGNPPLIAMFTYHDPIGEKAGEIDFQYQGIAYSNDRGRTWTKYEGNPVIPNPGIRDFRDTKVIWDDEHQQWLCVLAAWDHIKIYRSDNLIEWTYLSDFGKEWGSHAGVWECPDLFPITLAGSEKRYWILLLSINPGSSNGGSGTQYFVGQFDGTTFSLDSTFAQAFGTEEAQVPDGTTFADFESGFGEWEVRGEAFGPAPTEQNLPNQEGVQGYAGQAWLNSFHGGDGATGELLSPPFTIEKDFINFLIGGGNDKLKLGMELWVDSRMVRNAAGGNNDKLNWIAWDVSEYQDMTAQLRIFDTNTGGWGHIHVDQIMFADKPVRPNLERAVWLDYGRDNYAGVTWDNAPNDERVFIGWMSNWDYAQVVPTEEWRSAMTLPRTMALVETELGPRLASNPISNLSTLRQASHKLQAGPLPPALELPFFPEGTEMMLELGMEEGTWSIELANSLGETYEIGYDAGQNQFYSDRRASGKTDFSAAFAEKQHLAARLSSDATLKIHLFQKMRMKN